MKAILMMKDGKPYKAYLVEEYDIDKVLKFDKSLGKDVVIVDAIRSCATQVIDDLKDG